jgi:hypothetical protein
VMCRRTAAGDGAPSFSPDDRREPSFLMLVTLVQRAYRLASRVHSARRLNRGNSKPVTLVSVRSGAEW